jgi:hypothetical protein
VQLGVHGVIDIYTSPALRVTVTATGFSVSSSVRTLTRWSPSHTFTLHVCNNLTKNTLIAKFANLYPTYTFSLAHPLLSNTPHLTLTQLRGPELNGINAGFFTASVPRNLSGTNSLASAPQYLGDVCRCMSERYTSMPGFSTTGILLVASCVSQLMTRTVAWTVG